MLTVESVLALPVVQAGDPEVLAGRDKLQTPVRWVHVAELTSVAALLGGGELVLSTGLGFGDRPDEARRYLAGGLELRMDETRHVASWIGGQEALHERVMTIDEALAAIDGVTADDVQRLAGELVRDEGLRLSAVAPARYLRGLDRHLRLSA